MVCGPSSTVISQSTYTDSSLSDTQATNIGTEAIFILPIFLSSVSSCAIASAQVSEITGSIQVPASNFLNDPVLQLSGEFQVLPTDSSRHDDYKFYVKVMTNGGASAYSTSLFQF